jgi:GntR family transcriptional regulator
VAEKPIQQRIIDDVRGRIASGELQPGDQLPSISQMRIVYDASDTPIKAALAWLDATGYIRRHQGKGVYVAENPPTDR